MIIKQPGDNKLKNIDNLILILFKHFLYICSENLSKLIFRVRQRVKTSLVIFSSRSGQNSITAELYTVTQ